MIKRQARDREFRLESFGFRGRGSSEFTMRKPLNAVLVVTGSVWLAVLAQPRTAEAASPRQSMERCVDRVLATMAKARAPEIRVGSAVASQCDSPLRATLADAIRNGEAAFCTVESCLDLARSRASAEAMATYRKMTAR
jgi:hypothetical protein